MIARLVGFGLLFCGLSVAGFMLVGYWLDVDWSRILAMLGQLPGATVAVVAVLSVAVVAVEVWRFRVIGAALGTPLTWRAATDATVANFFFAWLTPGAALAEPATIYMLGRRGVPWDAATLIAFGKTATGLFVILALTFGCLAAGLGPELQWWLLAPFVTGTGVAAALMGVLLAGVFWPEPLTRWLEARDPRWRPMATIRDTAIDAVARLAHFRRAGFAGLGLVLVTHLVYFACFVGVFVVLAAALGGAPLTVVPIAVVYQCFTYFAPTPGGAGLAEGSAGVFFGDALGPEAAVAAVLLFRACTFYLHIVLGLVYLPWVGGMRLGGIREVMRRS